MRRGSGSFGPAISSGWNHDATGFSADRTGDPTWIAAPASGITSMAKLVARGKTKPEILNYASAGIGTTPHLTGEWLKSVAGISMTHVPFAGAGPALQAILGGTVPLMCAIATLWPKRESSGCRSRDRPYFKCAAWNHPAPMALCTGSIGLVRHPVRA
jgi:hypothetical protein